MVSYLAAVIEIAAPFYVLKIAKNYLKICHNKQDRQIFAKSFQMIYSEFNSKNVFQIGFFAIISFKKAAFAFILVFLNR